MKMIIVPALPVSPGTPVKTITSDGDTVSVSTGDSPAATMKKQLSSSSFSSEKDQQRDPAAISPSSPDMRRSIFNTYWQRNSSSISFRDDENGNEGSPTPGREFKRSPGAKLEPSYLGVYSFAPSPVLSPKSPPALRLSPISSADSLSLNSPRLLPKSILRRRRSFQPRVSPVVSRPGIIGTAGRPRSVSCSGPDFTTKAPFDIAPPPLYDDTSTSEGSELSKASNHHRDPDLKRQHSLVHFDPTITVRECVGNDPFDPNRESNWFSEKELKTFMAETVNLCHDSAVKAVRSYSLPHVKKAYEAAHEMGVKSPVLSTTHPEYRALFADPVMHKADEDMVVHDGSKMFFKIMAKEVQRVLIVDNCQSTVKLFKRHMLCMFPHAHIDMAMSGEDALDKIEVDSKRVGLNYDVVIVQERLQQCPSGGRGDVELLDLTGSELLRLMNEMESCAPSECNGIKREKINKSSHKRSLRRSLKIGVSVSLGEDCESLRNTGGADLFWSKPSPKPSNGLRNQIMNTLLCKRGKSVFICGC